MIPFTIPSCENTISWHKRNSSSAWALRTFHRHPFSAHYRGTSDSSPETASIGGTEMHHLEPSSGTNHSEFKPFPFTFGDLSFIRKKNSSRQWALRKQQKCELLARCRRIGAVVNPGDEKSKSEDEELKNPEVCYPPPASVDKPLVSFGYTDYIRNKNSSRLQALRQLRRDQVLSKFRGICPFIDTKQERDAYLHKELQQEKIQEEMQVLVQIQEPAKTKTQAPQKTQAQVQTQAPAKKEDPGKTQAAMQGQASAPRRPVMIRRLAPKISNNQTQDPVQRQAPSRTQVPPKKPVKIQRLAPNPKQAPSWTQVPPKKPVKIQRLAPNPKQAPSRTQVPDKKLVMIQRLASNPKQAPSWTQVPPKKPVKIQRLAPNPKQKPSRTQVPDKKPVMIQRLPPNPKQAPSWTQVPDKKPVMIQRLASNPKQAPSRTQVLPKKPVKIQRLAPNQKQAQTQVTPKMPNRIRRLDSVQN